MDLWSLWPEMLVYALLEFNLCFMRSWHFAEVAGCLSLSSPCAPKRQQGVPCCSPRRAATSRLPNDNQEHPERQRNEAVMASTAAPATILQGRSGLSARFWLTNGASFLDLNCYKTTPRPYVP